MNWCESCNRFFSYLLEHCPRCTQFIELPIEDKYIYTQNEFNLLVRVDNQGYQNSISIYVYRAGGNLVRMLGGYFLDEEVRKISIAQPDIDFELGWIDMGYGEPIDSVLWER